MFDYTDTRETLKSTAWMSVLLSINIKYNHIQIVSSFIIAILLSIASLPFIFVCPPRQRGTHGDKILVSAVLMGRFLSIVFFDNTLVSIMFSKVNPE